MKRKFTSVLAIALAFSVSTVSVAFADSIVSVNSGFNTATHDVSAKYDGGVSTPDVYSVDIEWGAMEFTYNVGGTRDWDAEKHSYTDNLTASWTASGNTVTVINHSNAAVTAEFEFNALEAYKTQVSGSFDYVTVELPSAEGKDVNAAELTGTSTLTLSGTVTGTLTDFTEVGSVTVTVE